MLVIKHFLALNKLNSAYLGGLSSYSIAIWVCAYLNRHQFETVDSLLLGILEYFGDKFDPKKTGVCIYNGFFELGESLAHAVTLDPINRGSNVTRTAYNIVGVLRVFSAAHKIILHMIRNEQKEILKHIFKPLS